MCPLNGVLSAALFNALPWIGLGFSYREVSEPKLQNFSLSSQGFLCILNETVITKKAMWIYAALVWEKLRSWLKRQTEIHQLCNLKRPSGRYSTYAFWLYCKQNSKDQPFSDPRYEHLAKTSILHNFSSLQRHRLAWIRNRKHSSQLKVYFFAIGIAEIWERQTRSWGRRRQSKTAFPLLLKPMMQIFMHEAERNYWVILLPCLKTYPHLKEELTTVPKFENMLMSEFCSTYMPSWRAANYLLIINLSAPLAPLFVSTETRTIFSTEHQCTSRLFYVWKHCLWKISNAQTQRPAAKQKKKKRYITDSSAVSFFALTYRLHWAWRNTHWGERITEPL